jgi:mannose-6-phosphate isomerase-like protein (cupin superfamily)
MKLALPLNILLERESEFITKKWGEEEILYNKEYCIKIMRLIPGQKVSLHFHSHKIETFILISGSLTLELIDKYGFKNINYLTKQFDSITLGTNVPHTFYCTDDNQGFETIFLEVSSYDDPEDSYRISRSGPRTSTDNR